MGKRTSKESGFTLTTKGAPWLEGGGLPQPQEPGDVGLLRAVSTGRRPGGDLNAVGLTARPAGAAAEQRGDSELRLALCLQMRPGVHPGEGRRPSGVQDTPSEQLTSKLRPVGCGVHWSSPNDQKGGKGHSGTLGYRPRDPHSGSLPHTHLRASRRNWFWPRGAAVGTWG